MEATHKVKNLIPGTYIINASESIQSSYGDTYKYMQLMLATRKMYFRVTHFYRVTLIR